MRTLYALCVWRSFRSYAVSYGESDARKLWLGCWVVTKYDSLKHFDTILQLHGRKVGRPWFSKLQLANLMALFLRYSVTLSYSHCLSFSSLAFSASPSHVCELCWCACCRAGARQWHIRSSTKLAWRHFERLWFFRVNVYCAGPPRKLVAIAAPNIYVLADHCAMLSSAYARWFLPGFGALYKYINRIFLFKFMLFFI